MKKIIRLSMASLLLVCGAAHAQSMVTGIDEAQIKGKWVCGVTIPDANGFSRIESHSTFDPSGTFTQDDTLVYTTTAGATLPISIKGAGRWRYESSTRLMHEVLAAVNVTFDLKNPLALTVGNNFQRAYQEAVGHEQPSFVIRLSDKEWVSTVGAGKSAIPVECKREI